MSWMWFAAVEAAEAHDAHAAAPAWCLDGTPAGVLAVWLAMPRPARGDHTALDRLYGPHALPHPGAVALGLVARPTSRQAVDPRVSNAKVVFRWVEQAPPAVPTLVPTQKIAIDPRDARHQVVLQ